MLAWISIRPQLRWNIRSENGPCVARDLVVVQLHRVHRAAAVLVVLGVGAEDAGQQHLGIGTQRMPRGRWIGLIGRKLLHGGRSSKP